MAENADHEADEIDLENHPGRPRGKDEIDPELIKLKRTRVGGGPVLALAIIFLCVYTIIVLWSDFKFSRNGDEPHEITSSTELTSGKVGADDFVRIGAHPDRGFALRLSEGLESGGTRIMPVLGSSDELWLMVGGEAWAEKPAYSDTYVGRLRRISDMPFGDALESYVEKNTDLPRFVQSKNLRAALETGAPSLVDANGDTLSVASGTTVDIYETVLDRARVRAFRRKALPDAAAWNTALTEIGLTPHGAGPVSEAKDHLIYEVDAPNGLAAAQQALIDAKLFAARADALERRHKTTWGSLKASDAGLVVGDTTLPWRNLTAVSLAVPRTVPSDALVVVTDEQPGDYWYMLPLYIVLGLFIAVFSWGLVRSIRAGRSETPSEASPPAEAAA